MRDTQTTLSRRALALRRQADQRVTLTIPEAAKRLGIGRNQGYEAARAGELPVIRVGKRLLVPLAAFEAMLADPSRRLQRGTEAA